MIQTKDDLQRSVFILICCLKCEVSGLRRGCVKGGSSLKPF